MNLSQLIQFYISLFVICSPFVAVPALISLTQGQSLEKKRQIGIKASISVGAILVIVTWLGGPILNFLGIRLEAFQLAGGGVVFLLALSMLNAQVSKIKQTQEDREEALNKDSIAVVPLAIPLMAGPGAIGNVIVFATSFPGIVNHLYVTICTLLVALTLGVCLYFACSLERLLGVSGLNILSRVGGLILAAIAIEIMAKGLIGLFPGLVV